MKSINRVTSKTSISGVSTAFDIAKRISIDMDMFPPEQPFEGFLSLIVVQVSNIQSTTKVILRVSRDEEGDSMIITDTESVLYRGITTSSKGSAIFALNCFVKVGDSPNLYAFVKSDTGSFDVDYIEMVYEGER
jgi:hypothetical protein